MEQIEELLQKHVGKACPKCGANLLTQKDFEIAKAFKGVLDTFESMGLVLPAEDSAESGTKINVNVYNGEIKFSGY
jgi:hypothetical protein